MTEPGGAYVDRLDADLLRYYRLSLRELAEMPGARAVGLVEALPVDAATKADEAGRPLPLILTARHIEVTHEIIRVLLATVGGLKRRQLPPPLKLLALPDEVKPDAKSPDPRAWSAAIGARVVKVS